MRYQRRNGPRLLPRDVFISVEQRTPGNLDPDEWAILRRVIDLIQVNAKGAELGPVLETIENALRADQAKLIEAELSMPGGGSSLSPLRRPHFPSDLATLPGFARWSQSVADLSRSKRQAVAVGGAPPAASSRFIQPSPAFAGH
jgi:hypothetical protein